MIARRYGLFGALFGLMFPVLGFILHVSFDQGTDGIGAKLARAQSAPLMWIIDTAPIFFGLFAHLAGKRQDDATGLAGDLFSASQTLLTSVSSLSTMNTQTAASVRDTTATMTKLGQTATQAALTAETVIGFADSSRKASEEGLRAAESSTREMAKLADDVRDLAKRIEGLNDRMRDIFGIASVVNYIGDRFKSLADSAVVEIGRIPASKGVPLALRFIVAEMRRQSEDAKGAANQVKNLLTDVQKTMATATAAAENGVKRAEFGAKVATATGENIRRLATALRDSSQAAKDIAVVAQQQDQGIDEVLKAMNEIFRSSEETMVSTKSVAQQAETLDHLAKRLDQSVRAWEPTGMRGNSQGIAPIGGR